MKELRVLLRVLKESEMAKRTARKPHESLRDYPIYTIPEASLYLAIPESTLRYWIIKNPVWKMSDPDRHLLSFRDIAQAYYLEMARKHFRLTLTKMRDVMIEARKDTKSEYPLIGPNVRMFLDHIFVDRPARGRLPRRFINWTRFGQLGIPEVVEPLSTRYRWTSNTLQLFPWRLWNGTAEDKRVPVMLDPDVMSGRLVITGTRIPVQVIALRKAGGESIPHLAKDYRISEAGIEYALEHLVPEKKAA